MPTLYVAEPRSTVRRQTGSLIVTQDEERPDRSNRRHELLEVELHRLELVAIIGAVHITRAALFACLDQGVAVAWFRAGGQFRGRIVPQLPRSGDLRLRQYQAWANTSTRHARAVRVLKAKIAGAVRLLEDIQSNYPQLSEVPLAIGNLKRLAARVGRQPTRDQLLGLEGTAARTYFLAFGTAFRGEITFTGRKRRPPPDPANSLLSFGYVLLYNLIAGLLEARGLDPALGFLHEPRSGRASLALDLIEELRHPLVDRFVLRVCNLRILQPRSFEPDPKRPGGVLLGCDGRKTFFHEWERFLLRPVPDQDSQQRLTVHQILQRQVDRLAADFRGQEPYQPFHYGG